VRAPVPPARLSAFSLTRIADGADPRERKFVTIGFTGTYTDDSAESDGIALAGKHSIRFKSKLRLLVPD
jgi:hypothetical protein